MKNATEYLGRVKALILVSPHVVHSETVREEAEGNMGLFRYRLRLQDDSLLAVFERFDIAEEDVKVTKYSFHWQDSDGNLRKRWDNAPHHSELPTHPHHVHVGSDGSAGPHAPIDLEEVLDLIAEELPNMGSESSR